VVHTWLAAHLKTFFSEGIPPKPVQLWTKCIEKQGTMLKNDAILASVLFC
jgi:hypothetical protein